MNNKITLLLLYLLFTTVINANELWEQRGGAHGLSIRSGASGVWTDREFIVWGGYAERSQSADNGGISYDPNRVSWRKLSLTNAPSGRRFHAAVWTGTEMIIWGGYPTAASGNGARYRPGADTWTTISTNGAPSPRYNPCAVWTGTEVIIWGGYPLGTSGSGARYNPLTDQWTAMSTNGAPSTHNLPSAVWTGSEIIVWAGLGAAGVNAGARYNPTTDTWLPISTNGAPVARSLTSTVWTGSEMILWGGATSGDLNSGSRYNPVLDTWTPLNQVGAPHARRAHAAVWSGSEMVIWGGYYNNGIGYVFEQSGGVYNPSSDSWTSLSTDGAPSGRYDMAFAWTGEEVLIWGGRNGNTDFGDSGSLNVGSREWNPVKSIGHRSFHTAVWSGREMLVWGGIQNQYPGWSYYPQDDAWTMIPTNSAPKSRRYHTALWTGDEMLVWGGTDGANHLATGGCYNPESKQWKLITITNAPSGRLDHTAVWTGTEMIIWGGSVAGVCTGTGARYKPSTDTWTTLPLTGALTPRGAHTAVWTGKEMILWGGKNGTNSYSDGVRYDPSSDQWKPISTNGAPIGRSYHTAVWTGNEMIIWGGYVGASPSTNFLNSGALYDPVSDSWATIAPTPLQGRMSHNAVWNGREMIIWGGNYLNISLATRYLGDGARYSPVNDSWTAITMTSAPSARRGHTAVWTGRALLVYGGEDLFSTIVGSNFRYTPYGPELNYKADSGGISLSWPFGYADFQLERSTTADFWTPELSSTPTALDYDKWQVIVETNTGKGFYRLRKQ